MAEDIRERTVLTNVTILENQGQAGFLVRDGAADIWINASRISDNWGDGINVSYAGGSVTINGTIISGNKVRGLSSVSSELAFLRNLKLNDEFFLANSNTGFHYLKHIRHNKTVVK